MSERSAQIYVTVAAAFGHGGGPTNFWMKPLKMLESPLTKSVQGSDASTAAIARATKTIITSVFVSDISECIDIAINPKLL